MRINHYARKRQHIYEQKKKHAIQWSTYDVGRDEREAKEDYEKDLVEGRVYKWQDPRNGGYGYWNQYYLSGSRKYAKYCTNRKIRSKYRNMIANMDHEFITAPRGSDYEKEFDYWWTIY